MSDGPNVPTPLGYLFIAGAAALAVYNLGRVARALRLDAAARAIGRWLGRLVRFIFGPAVSWLAGIAREAFLQGAHDGITEIVTEIVRRELRPNGGTNIRDAVDRIEVMAATSEAKLEGHIAWSERVMAQNDLVDPPDDDLPPQPQQRLVDPDADDGAL